MPAGLAGAAGAFTGGYMQQEGVELKRDAMAAETEGRSQARAGEADERKLKMDKMKETMRRENFQESFQHMMLGDFGSAEDAYNKGGKRQMVKGSAKAEKDEEGNTFFTWTDKDSGEQVVTEMKYGMMMTGFNPKKSQTTDDAQANAMELQNAKNTSGSTPAEVKIYNHIIKNLRRPDGQPYTPEQAWKEARASKSSRMKIAAQITNGIMKDNPGLSTEELQTKTDEIMLHLENTYSSASGGEAMNPQGGGGGGDGNSYTKKLQEAAARKARQAAITPGPDDDIEDDL